MTQAWPGNDAGIITKPSPCRVADTAAQLTATIAARPTAAGRLVKHLHRGAS